jgi:hypothetical protein
MVTGNAKAGGRPNDKLLDKVCVRYGLWLPALTDWNKQNKILIQTPVAQLDRASAF